MEDLQEKGTLEEGGPQIKENNLKNPWMEGNLQDEKDHLEDPQDPQGPQDQWGCGITMPPQTESTMEGQEDGLVQFYLSSMEIERRPRSSGEKQCST